MRTSPVTAAKMAVEDFGGTVLDMPIEVVFADHQNKAEIASATARAWFQRTSTSTRSRPAPPAMPSPIGTSGELCTHGYGVMHSYWDDPERSAEAIDPAGWMHSGDLATTDDQGYCTIVGRLKDMLIRGGENIYLREIEEFLVRHSRTWRVA
jgi:acyl-CoA synthetase (AMP-forming)/AMP-acid ligase II